MKIVEEAPVWEEDDEDAGAGEQLNDGMRNFITKEHGLGQLGHVEPQGGHPPRQRDHQ